MSVFLFNNIFIILIYSGVAGLFQRGGAQGELLLGVFILFFNPTALLGVFRGGACGSLWEPVGGGASPGPRGYAAVCVYTMFFCILSLYLKKIYF